MLLPSDDFMMMKCQLSRNLSCKPKKRSSIKLKSACIYVFHPENLQKCAVSDIMACFLATFDPNMAS